MFTIKKLKAPEVPLKNLQSPKGILLRVRKNPDTPRKVGFVDDIGKPLVEYRNLPPREKLIDGLAHPHHEKSSGQFISSQRSNNGINVKWGLLSVKNAKKPLEGALEMRRIEEKRLEDENVSRAPLFGTFNAFESPHLIDDAELRARAPVPIIPLETPRAETVPQLPQIPIQNTYQQVFENTEQMIVDNPETTTATTSSIFDLMAQLKQRGLVPAEQQPSSDNVQPMPEYKRQSRFSSAWKRSACTHFISNPRGCFHGDNCRFEHDEAQREAFQKEHQGRNPRADNWRQRPANRPFRGAGGGQRRFHRSRSPQKVA